MALDGVVAGGEGADDARNGEGEGEGVIVMLELALSGDCDSPREGGSATSDTANDGPVEADIDVVSSPSWLSSSLCSLAWANDSWVGRPSGGGALASYSLCVRGQKESGSWMDMGDVSR